MKKNTLAVACISLLCTPAARSFAGDAAAVYKTLCASCHGEDLRGNPPGSHDLDLTGRTRSKSNERLARKITNGDDGMPGYRDQLNAEEIQALVSYIKNPGTAQASPAPAARSSTGDAAAAYKTLCASCHGEDLRGNPPGAHDLDLTGRTRLKSDERLARKIMYGDGPMPGYRNRFSAEEIQALVSYIKNPQAAQASSAPAEAAQGEKISGNGSNLYGSKCASCHGKDGKGNHAMAKMLRVSLKDLDLFAHIGRHSDADYIRKISKGDGKMPAYKDTLTDAEIADLVAYIYIHRLAPASKPATPKAGKSTATEVQKSGKK